MLDKKASSKLSKFEQMVKDSMKNKRPKIQDNHNKTVTLSKKDLHINGFESLKTKPTSNITQANIRRRSTNNAASSRRTNSIKKEIIGASIKKNLSIADINYDSINNMNNTVKHKYTSNGLNRSGLGGTALMPSSVKYSSKPSTAASSQFMKPQMYNLKAKPSAYYRRKVQEFNDSNVSDDKIHISHRKPNESKQSSGSKYLINIQDQNGVGYNSAKSTFQYKTINDTGLDSKYLESSLDRCPANEYSVVTTSKKSEVNGRCIKLIF